MKLLFVRHGDPDYENDTLTARGREEAKLLIPRARAWKEHEIYLSPYGRADLTARLALELPETGEIPYQTLPWLREFDAKIRRPDANGGERIPWDWLPADWMSDERHFDRHSWFETPVFQASDVAEQYQAVCDGIDGLLEAHGYVRDGGDRDIPLYRVKAESTDTLVFFCHFGVTCVILSHLIGASPMVLWHGFCAAPTSVTVVRTEERRQGLASFRVSAYGDTSHLYAAGAEISPHARFAEVFSDESGRHD